MIAELEEELEWAEEELEWAEEVSMFVCSVCEPSNSTATMSDLIATGRLS